MDKATPTLRQRCDTALQSLPDAPYRAMLAALFDEMLAEVERLAAQAAPTGLTDMGWVIDAARSQAKEGDQHG